MSTSRAVLGLVAAALLSLTACGDRGDAGGSSGGAEGGSTAAVPVECPARLAEAEDPAPRATTDAPTLPQLRDAVTCTYQLSGDDGAAWVLEGEPRPVPEDVLADVQDAAGGLEPVAPDQMCTADAGPRQLLVAASDEGTVALVAEAFGCREVLFTSDPASVPPGEADTALAPPGRFGSAPRLADLLGAV